jgi:hypothetical protein
MGELTMSKAFGLLTFSFGVAAGAITAWLIARNKYEAISQEEIESVKAAFSKQNEMVDFGSYAPGAGKVTMTRSDIKPPLDTLTAKIREEGYANTSDNDTGIPRQSGRYPWASEGEPNTESLLPVVISPDDYGENEDYDQVSYTFYAGDGVLADEYDIAVDDPDDHVGVGVLSDFAESDDDSLFVRSDARRIYYEILRDQRRFQDVTHFPETVSMEKIRRRPDEDDD